MQREQLNEICLLLLVVSTKANGWFSFFLHFGFCCFDCVMNHYAQLVIYNKTGKAYVTDQFLTEKK